MGGGYMGKIGFVNLSNGEIREEKIDEELSILETLLNTASASFTSRTAICWM